MKKERQALWLNYLFMYLFFIVQGWGPKMGLLMYNPASFITIPALVALDKVCPGDAQEEEDAQKKKWSSSASQFWDYRFMTSNTAKDKLCNDFSPHFPKVYYGATERNLLHAIQTHSFLRQVTICVLFPITHTCMRSLWRYSSKFSFPWKPLNRLVAHIFSLPYLYFLFLVPLLSKSIPHSKPICSAWILLSTS